MSKRRFSGPPDFNPEKFLAKETKGPKKRKPGWSEQMPSLIGFAPAVVRTLIDNVAVETPEAFRSVRGGPDGTMWPDSKWAGTWEKAIEQQLGVFGIASDPVLIHFLLGSVIFSPIYETKVRELARE